MSPPDRPKGEFRGAQHEGASVNTEPLDAPLRGRDRRRIRVLKRLARSGSAPLAPPAQRQLSQQIILKLLDRSIRFGHRRLAVQRLQEAAEIGAPLRDEHWRYCLQVVASADDPELGKRLAAARCHAGRSRPTTDCVEFLCRPLSPI